jgi:type IV pilus secretin PilQ/predicted competence protein
MNDRVRHTRPIRKPGALSYRFVSAAFLLALAPAWSTQKPAGTLQPGPAGLALPSAVSPSKAIPATSGALVAITDISASSEDGRLVVSIIASGSVTPRRTRLSGPDRLVLDFANAENRVPFHTRQVNTAGLRQMRVSQFLTSDPKMTRIVFDLDESSMRPEVVNLDNGVKIVFPASTQAGAQTLGDPQTPAVSAASKKELQGRSQPRQSPPGGEISPPVIRDLSVAEIPTSALAVRSPEPPKPASPQATPQLPVKAPAPQPSVTSIKSGANPDAPSAQESRFSGTPLTLDLVELPLVDFFRLMAEEGGINVVMDPEIKGTISIKVVKVPWDQIFDAALVNNGLDKKFEGNLVRIAQKKTLQEEAKQMEALKKASLLAADTETRIKRLNYAKASGFVPSLTEQKTVRGTVVVDERTNSLIMTDIPSTLDKMIQLVESLDLPQPQVEIEARIVSATRDFARDLGVQFGFVQGNLERVTVGGPNTFGTIGGTRPSATPKTTYAAGNPLTGRGASESKATEAASVSTGSGGNYNVNLPAKNAFGGIGISVGNIFDTFLLDAAITAGESKGFAKLISQPKVTAQNNSPASITQGLRFPVQIVSNNTVTVQFQNAALTLTVTPQITYEGNIVLDLKVENNTPDFSQAVNGIPSIRTSESATRVLVSDGGTTVIGGILVENETTQEDRVPGLASLPVIGHVFKRTAVSHQTQEVLFFVTPRLVK